MTTTTAKVARFRNCCFTAFDLSVPIQEGSPFCSYMIYQQEICPKNGRRHIQGYIELKRQMTMKAIQEKIFGGVKVHIERRKGTQQQALDYCKKAETAVPDTQKSFGEPSEQGRRTDLEAMVDMACSGHGVMDVVQEHPSTIRFVRNIQLVASLVEPPFREVSYQIITIDELKALEDRPYFYHGSWAFYDNQTSVVCFNCPVEMEQLYSGHPLRFEVQGQPGRVCHISKVYFVRAEGWEKKWWIEYVDPVSMI